MSAGFNVLLRNAMLNQINTAANAGSGAAVLRAYSGTRPATGASIGGSVLLAQVACADPLAPAASGGVLSPTLPAATTNLATGTASWFRLVDSSGTHVMDGDVGVELVINLPHLVNGGPFQITSWSISAGNA